MHISLQYLHFTKYTKSFTMRINKDTTPVFHISKRRLAKDDDDGSPVKKRRKGPVGQLIGPSF